MDAKSKANFINSVATGSTVPCPKCGAACKPEDRFCTTCGSEMSKVENEVAEVNNQPAFGQISDSDNTRNTQAAAPVPEVKTPDTNAVKSKYREPESVFAQGLPEWSLEPPQIMVRRH